MRGADVFWMLAGLMGALVSEVTRADDPVDRLEQLLRASAGERFGATGSELARHVLSLDLEQVSDVYLVAVLLAGATGRRDPVNAAHELLNIAQGDLGRLSRADVLNPLTGLGPVALARLSAAKELSRRAAIRAETAGRTVVQSPEDARRVALPHLGDRDDERLLVIVLDARHRPLGVYQVTRGTERFTIVDPAQILSKVLAVRGRGFILVHNHPSGAAEPSDQDVEVTRRVAQAAQIMVFPCWTT